ncbi:MAG: hypothetical protein WAV07_08055 [Candidatus Contendobacter sp.]
MRKTPKRNDIGSAASDPPKPPDSFASWIRERAWKRWGVKGLFVIWVATALAGGSALVYQNWDKSWMQAVRQRFETPRQLDEQHNPLSLERTVELGFDHSYGTEDRFEYALLVQVTAQFSNEKYNDAATLRSISDLSLFALSTNENDPKIEGRATLLTRTESNFRNLEWIAEIVLEHQPTADLPITLVLGSQSARILVGKRKWQEYKYAYGATSRSWYRAQATVDLKLPPPDWPVVQSVRLLSATEPLTSIVEAVVHNYGTQPLALDQIALHGRHPRNSSDLCFDGDRPQIVKLDWEKIVSNGVSPASTELRGVSIQVPVKYRGAGICSDYSFVALVPIDAVVPINGLTRVQLLIKDLPPMRGSDGRPHGFFYQMIPDLSVAPTGLADWFQLEVSVNPSERSQIVFPREVSVARE